MVCFVPSVCLSIRKSCQRRDCSELGTVRNWEDHCITVQVLEEMCFIFCLHDSGSGGHFLQSDHFCEFQLLEIVA